MPTAIITGAAGIVGAEAVRFFASREFQVVGIDNDQRSVFWGPKPRRLGVETAYLE